jgi:micrococcal nuclease
MSAGRILGQAVPTPVVYRHGEQSLPLVLLVFVAPQLITGDDPSAPRLEIVARVVDGDTLVMRSGERIRLIWVDTPESVPVEFSRFLSKVLCVQGKPVRLDFDPVNAATGHKDNTEQKRTLAYVYLRDGTLLNAEIIRQGYGFARPAIPSQGWSSSGIEA